MQPISYFRFLNQIPQIRPCSLQGPAAANVPDGVYGVIDLYGQAAQATLIDLAEYRDGIY
jgi:hypothetical protein